MLFSAERAWSQSTSLKSAVNMHSQKKRHIARRLKKAIGYAELLSQLLESELVNADTQSQLEAKAYVATLSGQSAFERKQWDIALHQYGIAKSILDVFISQSNDTNRAIYKEAGTSVDPGLRYCAYQLGLQDDIVTIAHNRIASDTNLINQLKELKPGFLHDRQTTNLGVKSIQWRSRTASLEHPEIIVSLSQVQETQAAYDERLSRFPLSASEKADAMDDVLNAWAEAQNAVRKLLDEAVGTLVQDKEQNLQVILTYVSFHCIAARVRRDVLLIKSEKRGKHLNTIPVLKDLVRLHDSIIQVVWIA